MLVSSVDNNNDDNNHYQYHYYYYWSNLSAVVNGADFVISRGDSRSVPLL